MLLRRGTGEKEIVQARMEPTVRKWVSVVFIIHYPCTIIQ